MASFSSILPISFQSTLPVGGATPDLPADMVAWAISIHAPRGGSDRPYRATTQGSLRISIHAPRGGSDATTSRLAPQERYFNPRSPWGERPERRLWSRSKDEFQSTLPVGGATCGFNHSPNHTSDFNPRSPWGERRGTIYEWSRLDDYFNPRSPWGERHQRFLLTPTLVCNFNPRSPWGERRSGIQWVTLP